MLKDLQSDLRRLADSSKIPQAQKFFQTDILFTINTDRLKFYILYTNSFLSREIEPLKIP